MLEIRLEHVGKTYIVHLEKYTRVRLRMRMTRQGKKRMEDMAMNRLRCVLEGVYQKVE